MASRWAAPFLFLLLVVGSAPTVHASEEPQSVQDAIVPGERLSDWILRNAGPLADTTALQWRVDAERAPQRRLKQAVLQELAAPGATRLSVEVRSRLLSWFESLPVTGRLNLPNADPRWLQGSPAQDPLLADGHQVLLYPRSRTVTLVSEAARPCVATHTPGAVLGDYLLACFGTDAASARDWVWIAQSDGATRRFGVAPWNIEPQDEPAPGAWVWTPSRGAGIPDSVSDNLARFLATQPPLESPSGAVGVTVATETTARTPLVPPELKASDWGYIGLLQTPTARMAQAGDVRLHISRVAPYTRSTVMLQPLDWFEVGFRYTDVSNRLYGPVIAGNQTYKDKSIDVKLRLIQETSQFPQVAVGLVDLGGTGLFSGEYLVASKRWGNWDASLGLGWGYLGGRGNVKNPLSVLGHGFDTRPGPSVGEGGTVNTAAMFHGPAALFGGVQWQSSSSPWTFRAELDGNDYQHEPQSNIQVTKSPFNFGAVYTYSPNWDFSLAFERGHRFMLGMTFHGGLDRLYSPKLLDPALPSVTAVAAAQRPPVGLGQTAHNIALYTGWLLRSITHQGDVTEVHAEADAALYLQERIDRAVAVLHQDAPAASRTFVINLQVRGLPMTRVEVNRAEWVARHLAPEPPALKLPAQLVSIGLGSAHPDNADANLGQPGLAFDWGPSYSQILGGPDGFLLYQLGMQGRLDYRLSDRTWVSSAVNMRLVDNYDNFKYDAPSNLPRVRTYAREYVTRSRLTVPLLQATHVRELAPNQYLSTYAGMLEPMYGGVGAEWLYRPLRSRLALGVDVNRVRQRSFDQQLNFLDYAVTTGHATLYWDTGWNDVQVRLSAGRYLAGDKGATLDVRRVFANGVAMGAWATKTNVSAQQFGEGSFDKGIYVNIPFDAMLPKSSPSTANVVWTPLTRDGGARLNRRFGLFDLTNLRDPRSLQWRASKPAKPLTGQDTSYVLTEPAPNLFESLGTTGTTLAHQVADLPAATWLWAGGAVLAAGLLDDKVDRWAANHQTSGWNRVGTVANKLPAAMALGAGLLYTGIAGNGSASTAETALKAGAYTLATSTLARYAIGRARPTDQLGSSHFDGFNSSAVRSGMPSNHVALAFALATPYAQKHDMPWLYGVAGLSALGRIQSREHWLSDTVAAGLLGYGVASLVGMQDTPRRGVQWRVSPQSIQANWSFD